MRLTIPRLIIAPGEAARGMLAQVMNCRSRRLRRPMEAIRDIAGMSRSCRTTRSWTAARNPDRDWACRSPAQQGANIELRWGSHQKIRFTSVDPAELGASYKEPFHALLPIFTNLRGVSTGDFQEALTALLGRQCAEPVAGRDLAADGGVAGGLRRLAEARSLGAAIRCMCRRPASIRQATIWKTTPNACWCSSARRPKARKNSSRLERGRARRAGVNSTIDSKRRGREIALDLAVGDGALGFLEGNRGGLPTHRHQRCWAHKTANVLNKVALSVQMNMKADLRQIYAASTRATAEAAIDVFAEKYGAKYESGRLPDQGPG